ncbi:MAG: DUF1549 domain-containing protein [Planctomycetia bacterium]|nr:DUF1549 domain-containing protein [Planctomycetia bacterium]
MDAFLDQSLATRGIAPGPEADRVTLVRRLSFDLTGLPPDPAEIDAFLADPRPDAYESLVDRLLASPHHAERLAAWWLDLVRYADSVGYHGDQEVTMWPYRDWVIEAFATNMPFDRFTREQLAGDLLPGATRPQRVAAAYNRLNMMSAEGGGQDKEYHAKYAGDRVRATSGAWLGSTLGCAECHDHKYDPFTTRDFYAFASFFADVAERGIYQGANNDGVWGEMMRLPTPDQEARQREHEARLAAIAPPAEAGRDVAEAANAARARLQAELDAVLKTQVAMPATVSKPPRTVRILPRGNWMDDSGAVVLPAAPAFLPAAPGGEQPRRTRLDLAAWMTSAENHVVPRSRGGSTTMVRRVSRPAIRSCSTGWPATSATAAGTFAASCGRSSRAGPTAGRVRRQWATARRIPRIGSWPARTATASTPRTCAMRRSSPRVCSTARSGGRA